MKRRILSAILCLAIVLSFGLQSTAVMADSSKVVTIGANLSEGQKADMYKYFGTTADQVEEIIVTNDDERSMLEGIASEADIGKRTWSCSYICPTEEGSGIRVQLANINKITSNMIASALTTAGIYNCDVLAAAPMDVSGTGALTGIMMAFEAVSDKEISEEQKKLATEELVTTSELSGELKDEIVTDDGATAEEAKEKADNVASGIMNEVKAEVIANNVTNETDITNIVNEVSNRYDITLNQNQVTNIVNIMSGISKQEYDKEQLSTTLNTIATDTASNLGMQVSDKVTEAIGGSIDNAKEEATGFFGKIGNFFKGIGKAIGNFFKGIGNWFMGLFGKGSDDSASGDATETSEPTATDSGSLEGGSGIFDNINSSALPGGHNNTTVDEIQTTPQP